MSQENIAYYQRIVCIGLRRMTKDSALIRSGFLHWCKTLSHKEFDIAESVTELVNYLGLDSGDKKSLMITFHAASNKLFDELPAVPEVLLNMVGQSSPQAGDDATLSLASQANSEKVVAAKSPQLIVTEKFLAYFVVFFGKYSKEDLVDFKGIIIDEGIKDTEQSVSSAIVAWAASGFSEISLPNDISGEQCSDISHKLYILMSEVIGPVEADKIVHVAIDEALKLEVASRFSPKNLL